MTTSIFLAAESPLEDPKSTSESVLKKIDYTITALFALEAFLKIVTLGLFRNGKHSYLRSPWNLLDFVVVVVSVAEIAVD